MKGMISINRARNLRAALVTKHNEPQMTNRCRQRISGLLEGFELSISLQVEFIALTKEEMLTIREFIAV